MRRLAGLLVCLLLPILPLRAQTLSSAAKKAAGAITSDGVKHRIYVIADDSMGGRDTPSRGLDLTAEYVASEFKRFGLKPAGDEGGYLQRYPIQMSKIDPANSTVEFTQNTGTKITISFNRGAFTLFGSAPKTPVAGSLVLLGGVVDSAGLASVQATDVKDKMVFWLADQAKVQGIAQRVVRRILSLGAKNISLVSNRDSASFAKRVGAQGQPSMGSRAGLYIAEVSEAAIVEQVPEAAGQFSQIRAATSIVIAPLPEWEAKITIKDSSWMTSAPNTVGVLEGSDPALKKEYVVFSAHMDHIGMASSGGQCTAKGDDGICNGADDDGSGTVGVMELAKAYTQTGARPKRSMVFMTVSGEEKGLLGSEFFADHPTVPLDHVVADLNMDMIGRNWEDTIAVIGREHSDLGQTLDGIAHAHPELRMTPIGDRWPEENIYFRSDHYNFAKRGVPILFFTSGLHPDYHQASDSPEKIGYEKEARLLRLVYFLGQKVANTAEKPKWNPESYAKIVKPTP